MTHTKDDTLKMALEQIKKAKEKVSSLCYGEERWTMSIPVRPDYDHDVVISRALSIAEKAIKQALAAPVHHDDTIKVHSTPRILALYDAYEICKNQEIEETVIQRKIAVGICAERILKLIFSYLKEQPESNDFMLRGVLASELKCWHRLTEDEQLNLLKFMKYIDIQCKIYKQP